jgi:hypothetical protein
MDPAIVLGNNLVAGILDCGKYRTNSDHSADFYDYFFAFFVHYKVFLLAY